MKLLLREAGTVESRDLFFGSSRVVSSRLLVPETSAAIGRAARGQRLPRRSIDETRERALSLLAQVGRVEVDDSLTWRAWHLAHELPLRGYDAIHLASFERIESGDALLVAADGSLAHAARSLGYAVAVPA